MRITEAGIIGESLTDWKTKLEAIFKEALGNDLDLSPETPQGQLIGVLALTLAQSDEVAVSIANGRSVSRAVGRQQEDIASLVSITRRAGERSRVTATITGEAGAEVPEGMIARTEPGGDDFRVITATLIPAGGSVNTVMESAEIGAIQAAAGSLNRLVTPPSGIETITNAAAATPGRPKETDAEFRKRYMDAIARIGTGYKEAIRSKIMEQPNVMDAEVFDNVTNATVTKQGINIGAHSIIAIVYGGQAADIAQAIRETKPLGIGTTGTTSHEIDGTTYRYEPVDEVALAITLQIRVRTGFPSDGIGRIRENIVAWAEGEFDVAAEGTFDTTGLSIGENINLERLRTPINAVHGHDIVTLTVREKTNSGTQALTDPELNELQTIAAADISISIVP